MARRDANQQRQDVRACFRAHGKQCIKCGEEARVEAHHVYGPQDRNPDHIRPLCKWCHYVAPMGDAYWEWEKSGEPGWTDMGRIMNELFAYYALPHEQRRDVPLPRHGLGSLVEQPKVRQARKPKPNKPQPVEYSPCTFQEIITAIQNWRRDDVPDVQIAHRFMKMGIIPPSGYRKWSVFAVKTILQREMEALAA